MESPLFLAVNNGDIESIKVMLAQGVDIDQIDSCGNSPLYIAAKGGYLQLIKFLAETEGCYMGPCPGEGKTPIFIAAEEGHAECIRALHQLGGDICRINSYTASTRLRTYLYYLRHC
jgi:ankyrin repeat protein